MRSLDVRFDDGNQFRQLAGKFRAAGQNGAAIRKALTATIQAELKPVVADIQREARGMKVKTQSSGLRGGALARSRFDAAKEQRRQSKALAQGKKVRASRRALAPTGLRERTARAVKSRVSYTGHRMGARVYVDVSNFPGSQRKLPRHLNNPKGWRHPVFGNRRVWVKQVGEPYFDRPILRHRDRVRRNVAAAVNKVMEKLG